MANNNEVTQKTKYKLPDISLLSKSPESNNFDKVAQVREMAVKMKNIFQNFGVNVTIINYTCGPTATMFEIQLEQGVRVNRILNLTDELKLNLAVPDIHFEVPIPGKSTIGIEVMNKEKTIVTLREMIESENFKNMKSSTAFAVGKDKIGQVVVTDISQLPHLLIAGTTGSGKSVCINTLIMSILYKATPEEVKFIMIDPKMIELSCYNGIPHLLMPVITDSIKALRALNWATEEMTRRYRLFTNCGAKNLKEYNKKIEQAYVSGNVEAKKLKKLPSIVVIIDDFSDLMVAAHSEFENTIVKLSQLARAAGIHLVIATQRPTVNVITGLIKANIPSRIAFAVPSRIDSMTILDMPGAEKLLGKGDMLFHPVGYLKPVRVQGTFVSDDEIAKTVDYIKKQNNMQISDVASKSINNTNTSSLRDADRDDFFEDAGRFIIDEQKASIGMLQRELKIGFNRAARIMDQLETAGVVGPEVGTKARDILMTMNQFDEFVNKRDNMKRV